MSISIQCDDCKKQMKVADQWAGKRAKCRNCGNVIQIPSPVDEFAADDAFEPEPPPYQPSFASQSSYQPSYQTSYQPEPAKQSNTLVLALSGGVVAVLLIGFTIIHFINSGSSKPPDQTSGFGSAPAAMANQAPASATDGIAAVAADAHFPDLPKQPAPLRAQVTVYPLKITGSGPGLPMNIRLYLPTGRNEPHSLPCVFIAPAGTRMLYGSALGDGDSPEHLPYALAGFAVLAYELSGDMPGNHDAKITYASMKNPVQQFLAADGGLANARLAVDFVLAKVPQVDPQQLYAAGHSSAATMALNAVEADHRFRAVAAYAPRCDVVAHWGKGLAQMNRVVPGASDLAARVSPIRHVGDIACPVLIFHADNDSRVPTADNTAYVQALQAAGKTVKFCTVATGDHYDSMIDEGIPAGMKFFLDNGAHPLPAIRGAK
jgi:dienelactone hydrolase